MSKPTYHGSLGAATAARFNSLLRLELDKDTTLPGEQTSSLSLHER
ncbi:MAG TPA: hypothetical protein VGM17_16730 [Rhizomicrobium sp.]|jgi:hypothetical protein